MSSTAAADAVADDAGISRAMKKTNVKSSVYDE